MRIWSIHPKYLDAKGIVALWRETLLAKNVLGNMTIGYKYHPQLIRFKKHEKPLHAINFYLKSVYQEAICRGYNFDFNKIDTHINELLKIEVTNQQIEYELKHLLQKLKKRDKEKYCQICNIKQIKPHPLFRVVKGKIEEWEII
jgi:hypothetical protein